MDKKIEFKGYKIALDSGDVLIFYTDGIINALNEEGDIFCIERLKKLVIETNDLSSKTMIQQIKNEMSSFSKDKPQFDDMTLVGLKVK